MLAPVVVAAVAAAVVIVEVVAPQFPVFSLFSLLLFRYLLPPPPPTARPPASALHHPASREAHLRRPVRTIALGTDGVSGGSVRPGAVEGSLEGASAFPSVRQAGGVVARRGSDSAFLFFGGVFLGSPPPAPPLMLLLSERRNRQWDRSPSSACTSLLCAGSAQLSFENGGSVKMRDHISVAHRKKE